MGGPGRADALVAELSGILASTIHVREHPPAVSRMLEQTVETVSRLTEQLVDLQQFVILEAEPEDDRAMVQARRAWDALPSDKEVRDVRELTLLSPTLATLHRAAVTVTSMYRYSEERVSLAQAIGQRLGRFPRYIGQLVPRPDQRETFLVDTEAIDGVEAIIDRLTHEGAIAGFSISGQFARKDDTKFWMPRSAKNRGWKAQAWRVTRGEVAPEWKSFLAGHWLTAYAYGIARDQFERVGADFEIYSNVRYTLPGDLGGGSSDVDVLVRTSNVILSIECKSGRVLAGQPTQAAKTARSAERFDRILDTMEVRLRRIYQLLYFESDTEPAKAVHAATSGNGVELMVTSPSEVRLTIQRIANGQSLDDVATLAS